MGKYSRKETTEKQRHKQRRLSERRLSQIDVLNIIVMLIQNSELLRYGICVFVYLVCIWCDWLSRGARACHNLKFKIQNYQDMVFLYLVCIWCEFGVYLV